MIEREDEMLSNMVTGLSVLLNALTFTGLRYETLSARCWRSRDNSVFSAVGSAIDALFFWQDNHCQSIYNLEVEMGIQ